MKSWGLYVAFSRESVSRTYRDVMTARTIVAPAVTTVAAAITIVLISSLSLPSLGGCPAL